ncbi:MAG: helix-turn-helix domain-containing protein [Hyphomicrobiales bacterium]|nr:helix-turn-helix domain-containing protein [Hyphomicrobiales bacterium]
MTLSISDTAQRLGLSERTIHHLISSGEIVTIKIGRRQLIPHSAG